MGLSAFFVYGGTPRAGKGKGKGKGAPWPPEQEKEKEKEKEPPGPQRGEQEKGSRTISEFPRHERKKNTKTKVAKTRSAKHVSPRGKSPPRCCNLLLHIFVPALFRMFPKQKVRGKWVMKLVLLEV